MERYVFKSVFLWQNTLCYNSKKKMSGECITNRRQHWEIKHLYHYHRVAHTELPLFSVQKSDNSVFGHNQVLMMYTVTNRHLAYDFNNYIAK